MNTPFSTEMNWSDVLNLRLTEQFRCKVPVIFETEQYVLKTATSALELEAVLRLRHKVFFEELQNKKNRFSIEFDHLDFQCDHLLITDRKSQRVVGCYRLMSSHFIEKFYSEAEFNLTHFLAEEQAPKLELGRACILPEHRNGSVIQLLWRGITDYMKKTDARFLLGCSSVQTIQPKAIAALINRGDQESWFEDHYRIRPTMKYHPINHGVNLTPKLPLPGQEDCSLAIDIPPLVYSYLKAGAKLAPLPAVDLEFGCIDFFTLLDREKMHPLFLRRYFGH